MLPKPRRAAQKEEAGLDSDMRHTVLPVRVLEGSGGAFSTHGLSSRMEPSPAHTGTENRLT